MEMFSIASGSSGNSIFVGDDSTRLLIDAGISGKRIEEGVNTYGYTTADFDGVLVTHEHGDHICGLGVIARKYGLPIYATKGTIEAIKNNAAVGKIDAGLFREIQSKEEFCVGSLCISPIPVSHDAAEPVSYVVSDGIGKVGVLTDLGTYDEYIIKAVQNLDVLLLEANHDINMLQVGSYPYALKQRILGVRGHLSNERSGQLLGQILHDKMKHIFLGHLSKENNYPELAYETVRLEITMGDNPYRGGDFPIEVAARDSVSSRITI